VHHSRARGGKPREEQQRSHAWEVVDRWLRVATVDVFLLENVPEFQDWGPLDDNNQPVKAQKGEYFRAFVADLESLGYIVDWRVLCAADFGDPTTRRRLFLQAVRDGLPVVWPTPTHRDPRAWADMFRVGLPKWKAAASCIDFNNYCPSIFQRRKPLCEKTLATIKQAATDLKIGKGFLLISYYGNATWQTVDRPLATITTKDRHALVHIRNSDIGMRMLEPRELAAAMGFPADYQWTDLAGKPLTKRDQVKMIGNACPVNTVCELVKSVVRARPAYARAG
jgi:DNA (cytosine-5)-methyltransferase 1